MPSHISMTSLSRLGTSESSSYLQTPSGFSLQFDGNQNYVDCGTLGNFGSNLGSGLYLSFDINTTTVSTNRFILGFTTSGAHERILVQINAQSTVGLLSFILEDNSSKILAGHVVGTTLNDGKNHTVTITAIGSTNSMTITIDGVVQTISVDNNSTPTNFGNLTLHFYVGAQNNQGTASINFSGLLDNIQIGTSPTSLYGYYKFDEGSGTTAIDSSGQGNNGLLIGSPPPTYVSGNV